MSVEFTLNINVNFDAADITTNIETLEACPPCLTYYDYGDQMKRYIHTTFLEKVMKGANVKNALIASGSADDIVSYQKSLRERLVKAIGGLPETTSALNPVVTGTVEGNGFTIEKIIFNPRTDVYVTSNLYIPAGLTGKTPAVLFVCGHAENAKAFHRYQHVCHTLAGSGFVVFAVDPVGQGERHSYFNPETKRTEIPPCCPEHDYVGAQCMLTGDSAARYFLHDMVRAVDYLCTRPEVDVSRIAITGNSGGGTQSALMMLYDERIAAAAIGTFITGMPEYMKDGIAIDAEQVWNGIIQDGFDYDDILLAMAPRPVIVLAAEYDYFPIEGTRRVVKSAKRFYEKLKAEQNLELFSEPVQHGYSPNMADAACNFLSRHLLGAAKKPGRQIHLFSPAELNVTAAGQVRAEYENAAFIFEENVKRYKEIKAGKDNISMDTAKTWLKERVNYNRKPVDFNVRRFGNIKVDELKAEALIWWSNEDVFNHLLYITPDAAPADAKLPITVALWDGGSRNLAAHLDWIRQNCRGGRAVGILDVTGLGPLRPNRVNTMPMHRFEGTFCEFSHLLIWQGDSLPALWTWDVLRCLQMLREFLKPADIQLYGDGRFGVYAAMAAFIAHERYVFTHANPPKTPENIVENRFYEDFDIMSHVMPGVLKYFNIVTHTYS